MIIEIAEFKLNENTNETDFLKIHNELHENWVAKQSGYLRRETVKGSDGLWKDVVVWESIELAKSAAEKITNEPGSMPWMQMISSESVRLFHGEVMTDFN